MFKKMILVFSLLAMLALNLCCGGGGSSIPARQDPHTIIGATLPYNDPLGALGALLVRLTNSLSGTMADETFTDGEGGFQLDDVKNGDWTLTFYWDGHRLFSRDITLTQQDPISVSLGLPDKAEGFADTILTGLVLDMDQQPIVGASALYASPKGHLALVTTDETGRYEIDSVSTGEGRLVIFSDDLITQAYDIFATEHARTQIQDVILTDKETGDNRLVYGTVRDDQLNPLAGVVVWVYKDGVGTGQPASALTDDEGYYEITDASKDADRIKFSLTGFEEKMQAIEPGETPLLVNAQLGPPPLGT